MYKRARSILEFVDNLKDQVFFFSYVPDKNGIRVVNNYGNEVDPWEVFLLLEGLKNNYTFENENQLIELKKKQIEIEIVNYLDYYGPKAESKEFRKNLKKNWSFYCKSCGSKVSSITHKEWWMISDGYGSNNVHEKYCSKSCAKNKETEIKKEMIHNLRENLYKKYGID